MKRIKFSDYTPPDRPMVVIDGVLVECDDESIAHLAQNAMLLSLGAPAQPTIPQESKEEA